MSTGRGTWSATLNHPIVIGTITILVVAIAVYLSYIAENGLPFVPTYNVKVDVANADELVKNADVRVGGARVGQVLSITPEPATKAWPHPFARLRLALNRNLAPLGPDSHYRVRLASVLGGKYLEIIPGPRRSGGLPDGGTLTLNANPQRSHELPFVDLDTAFATFGPKTRQGLRGWFHGLSDTLAGRGGQLNDAIYSLDRLLPPLEDVMRILATPGNRFSQFVSGLASTTGALAAVAPTFTALLADSATTFAALDRSALGQMLEQLPPTETVTTTVLGNSLPVLSEADLIAQELKPGASLLPLASTRLADVVTSATPVFGRIGPVAAGLQSTSAAVDALARDPASTQTFKALGSNDLATFGSSAFLGLGAILRTVAPAQFACNVAGLWSRNFASALTEGDSSGSWLRVSPLLDPAQGSQAGTPAGDLHLNYYPLENASQCQAANEPYVGAQLIGNPSRTSTTVDNTSPPPGVLARGRKAGLVP
jgi:virulence factor Mce-like protein